VTSGSQDPANLAQHPFGVLEVMEHMDAPDQADARVRDGQQGAVGDRDGGLAERLGGPISVVLDPDRTKTGRPHPA